MFGFPRFTQPDYGYYTPRAPRQVYRDPYQRAAYRHPYEYFDDEDQYVADPWAVQRQKQQLRRQQELAAQQERERQLRLKRQQQQQRQQQVKARHAQLRAYNEAATIIQRAWRRHSAQVQAEREAHAAAVVTRCVRRVAAALRARRVLDSLRRLAEARKQLDELASDFTSTMRGYRALLMFTDQVEKLILRLDAIPHHRNDYVRARRKAIVRDAQQVLRLADVVLHTFNRQATVAQRAFRAWRMRHQATARDQAARVVTRCVRNAPAIREAKAVRRDLAQMQEQLAALRSLEADYQRSLQEMAKLTQRLSNQHRSELAAAVAQHAATTRAQRTSALAQASWPQWADPNAPTILTSCPRDEDAAQDEPMPSTTPTTASPSTHAPATSQPSHKRARRNKKRGGKKH
ncbi:uncharacterized protein MONBRDRAFT_23563 [Monosiga brevicollis MX1]|uniref:BAG domain-containing protein n=1 Tax=Monosiga brevicollis TaxID=81824 RepID=A9UTT6_MONBE|nr:uncharacterized protein MONBRDRAFT_23563 [Monosiga brevicollis MX1]EDQ91303.1 predicted protein [Monosiga brevicollis MX1]|eukprot:XP_001743725.1 hypothetical protein [Monosiga brevicollis MX1]